MGYVAQPFAVELEKVKQVFGSKDTDLYQNVMQTDLFEHYAEECEDYDLEKALHDIIFTYKKPEERKTSGILFGILTRKENSGLNREFSHVYGYAVLTICGYLGTYLSPKGDIFYAGESWKQANKYLSDRVIAPDLERMWEDGRVFDIPPIDDFPVINYYSYDEILHLLIELEDLEISEEQVDIDHPSYDEVLEILYTFKEGLKVCRDKNCELVSFTH